MTVREKDQTVEYRIEHSNYYLATITAVFVPDCSSRYLVLIRPYFAAALQCCLLQVTSLAGWVVATGGYRGELPRTIYIYNATKTHAVCNLFIYVICFWWGVLLF